MKQLLMITLLTATLASCQKEEQVTLQSSTVLKTECEESARKAKEALENKSGMAFDLSGANQSTGCSTETTAPTFEP